MADGILVDQGLLNQVARDVRATAAGVATVNALVVDVKRQVYDVEREVKEAEERIKKLKAFVEDMRREQRNAAALQRALTEIIRVRQELEQKFGQYKRVRDAMLGILESTDAALVTKETISRISEELTVGTPRYWLAPCVVAIAAWIANDKALANRAIEEAIKRDPQKTALLMALVCRRNAKYDASKSWLTLYFEIQDATDISRSVLLFVNAYTNGIFDKPGEHGDDASDEFIRNKWLPELEALNSNFKIEQEAFWTNKFCATADSRRNSTVDSYKILSQYSDKQAFEFAIQYLCRIKAAEQIAADMSDIIGYQVDTSVIKAQIDEYLGSLVTDYDESEVALREEEAEYEAIKQANGDVDIAKAKIAKKKAKKILLAEKVSLIEFLNSTIAGTRVDPTQLEDNTGKSQALIAKQEADRIAEYKSEQKLALKFTKYYVQDSYDNFMEEKAKTFPKQIKVRIEDVDHVVASEADKKAFSTKVTQSLTSKRDADVAAVKPTKAFLGLAGLVAGIFLAVVINWFFLVAGIVAGAVIGYTFYKQYKDEQNRIIAAYDARMTNANKLINAAVDEWLRMCAMVTAFQKAEKFDIRDKI